MNKPVEKHFILKDGTWKCDFAAKGMHKLYREFKEEFPKAIINYYCKRNPTKTRKGFISGNNTTPRIRYFTIKFTELSDEAVFLMKYIAEQ